MRTLKEMIKDLDLLPIETAIYALKRGEKFFRARRSCRRKHLSIRYTNGGACVFCISEMKGGNLTEKAELPNLERKEFRPEIKYPGKLRTKTLDKIKSGVLYIVLGNCESGGLE